MAIGKNKNTKKGTAQSRGKKPAHLLKKKMFYRVFTPMVFGSTTELGYTIVNRQFGEFVPADALKGRIVEANQGDLTPEKDGASFRKFKLRVEHVEGLNCYTQVHGMSLTTERIKHTTRKLFSLIEASVDVRTADDYVVRLFVKAQTRRKAQQVKKTTYAKTSQVRLIRSLMVAALREQTEGASFTDLVAKLIQDAISKEIEKKAERIFPLQTVCIYKMKVLSRPSHSMEEFTDAYYSTRAIADMGMAAAPVAWGDTPAETENATFEEPNEEAKWED